MRRSQLKQENAELREAINDSYWMILGANPAQELLAVERRLSKALDRIEQVD